MTVNIKRTGNEYIIKLPLNIDVATVQKLVDDLYFYEIKSRSKATEEDIAKLSKSVKRNWSSDIKERLKNMDEFKDLNL